MKIYKTSSKYFWQKSVKTCATIPDVFDAVDLLQIFLSVDLPEYRTPEKVVSVQITQQNRTGNQIVSFLTCSLGA